MRACQFTPTAVGTLKATDVLPRLMDFQFPLAVERQLAHDFLRAANLATARELLGCVMVTAPIAWQPRRDAVDARDWISTVVTRESPSALRATRSTYRAALLTVVATVPAVSDQADPLPPEPDLTRKCRVVPGAGAAKILADFSDAE